MKENYFTGKEIKKDFLNILGNQFDNKNGRLSIQSVRFLDHNLELVESNFTGKFDLDSV